MAAKRGPEAAKSNTIATEKTTKEIMNLNAAMPATCSALFLRVREGIDQAFFSARPLAHEPHTELCSPLVKQITLHMSLFLGSPPLVHGECCTPSSQRARAACRPSTHGCDATTQGPTSDRR